jgi:hypothetical protein
MWLDEASAGISRKMRKAKRTRQQQIQADTTENEPRKCVTFNPCQNFTRIFHRKDTPQSIARQFKKPQVELVLKPILRYS